MSSSAPAVNKPYAEATHATPAKAVNHREHPDIEEKKENLRSLHRDENHSDAAITNRSTSGRKGGSGSSGNFGSTHSSLQAAHGAGGQGVHPNDTDRSDDLIGKPPSEPRAGPTLAEKLANSPDDVGKAKKGSSDGAEGETESRGGSGDALSEGLLRTPAAEMPEPPLSPSLVSTERMV
ncbi:unnamed protein product [Parajaminaea phylloscopi]